MICAYDVLMFYSIFTHIFCFTIPLEYRSFLGGIVRLAAHDFMDYDINDAANPMGMDGCTTLTILLMLACRIFGATIVI